jgi:hypothetical protein
MRAARDDTVVVGYNIKLAVAVGTGAAVMWVLLLGRALIHTSVVDGLVAAALAVIAIRAVIVVLDSAPLAVADDRGIRVRVAGEWCGLPWVSISRWAVRPRRFPWSDGQLQLDLYHPSHVTEGLSALSRRQVSRNQRHYGATLVVPLGIMTGISRKQEAELAARLQLLSGGSRVQEERAEPTHF